MGGMWLGSIFGGPHKSSNLDQAAADHTASEKAALEAARKASRAKAAAAGPSAYGTNLTGPLGLPGSSGMPAGYKTLLGS